MKERSIGFEQAKRRYVHRFTMDHVPHWAQQSTPKGYYAPQYASDQEWYDNTLFPGEGADRWQLGSYSTNQTWPLGKWLTTPFRKSP